MKNLLTKKVFPSVEQISSEIKQHQSLVILNIFGDIDELQDEIAELRKEIALLRGRMSEEKWTPGPWVVNPDGPRYCINSGDSQSRHIAMASCYAKTEADEKENEANANLIAAAPDLLEALVELVCCPVFTGALFEADPYTHKRWTLARASISKAKGGNK